MENRWLLEAVHFDRRKKTWFDKLLAFFGLQRIRKVEWWENSTTMCASCHKSNLSQTPKNE